MRFNYNDNTIVATTKEVSNLFEMVVATNPNCKNCNLRFDYNKCYFASDCILNKFKHCVNTSKPFLDF